MTFLAAWIWAASAVADTPVQVHLAFGADPSTQVVVRWSTSADTVTHQVRYGTTASLGTTVTGTSAPAPNGIAVVVHEVALSNLNPDTLYYYDCGDATQGRSAITTFRTASVSPRAYTFAAYGDQGTNATTVQPIEAGIAAQNPDAVLLLGDLCYAYNSGNLSLWTNWLGLIEPVASKVPHIATLGNHELESNEYASFQAFLSTPGGARWYSSDLGQIHVVTIDSQSDTSPGSPQYLWVAADLAAATKKAGVRWKIVTVHYAPYSSSNSHPGDGAAVRDNLGPIFDACHVDLLLCGHEHEYERTFPLLAGGATDFAVSTYLNPAGTVYAVVGTGGRSLNGFTTAQPVWSCIRFAANGFAKISIDAASTLDLKFLRGSDLAQLDQFTITKSAVDVTLPTVLLTGVYDGEVLARVDYTLQAVATDNEGVTRVEFSVDGSLVTVSDVPPFRATWSTGAAAGGGHSVAARAFDRAGNSSVSAVTVVLPALPGGDPGSNGRGLCGLLGVEVLLVLGLRALVRRAR